MDREHQSHEGRDEAEFTTDAAEARLTAYVLDELDASERAEVEALLARDPAAREQVEQIRELTGELRNELAAEARANPAPGLAPAQRQAIEERLGGARVRTLPRWLMPALAAALLVAVSVWQLDRFRAGPTGAVDDVRHVVPTGSRAARSEIAQRNDAKEKDGAMQLMAQATAPAEESRVAPENISAEPVGSAVAQNEPAAAPTNPAAAAAPGPGSGGAGDRVAVGGKLRSRKAVQPPAALDVSETLHQLGYVGGSHELAAVPAQPPVALGADTDDGITARHGRRELYFPQPAPNTEGYAPIVEAGFLSPLKDPLSTFSIDVDTASYANVRRFLLKEGRLPPADAVRIEELVNYFHYDYPQPDGETPFGASVKVMDCPWAKGHRLVRIGLKGRDVDVAERAASNLVFLCDVSGSMDQPDKLPMLVSSLRMLVSRLDARDLVALVTYAGNAGLVLDSTPCTPEGKQKLLDALENLRAGGSTAGSAGIQLAYETAAHHHIKGGTNRVILATDGDFNVGITDKDALQRLITTSAKSGVFLSVLGFGTGNLQDGTAELLADKGNGNYAYIDSLAEAQKVLVQQMGGTLITIAKDVKVQVEWNPAKVSSYRLIGYENRALAPQDFRNDKKDAGEIGAGHTVTALYEVVPPGMEGAGVDPLRYQPAPAPSMQAGVAPNDSPELLYLKLRWKLPEADTSTEMALPVTDAGHTLEQAGADAQFAAAVAAFGMLLRGSDQAGDATWEVVLSLARAGRGTDPDGYRAEFVRLAQVAQALQTGSLDIEQLGYVGGTKDNR